MPVKLSLAERETILAAMGRSFRKTSRPIRMQGRIVGCEFSDEAMLDTILDLIDEFDFQKEPKRSSLN